MDACRLRSAASSRHGLYGIMTLCWFAGSKPKQTNNRSEYPVWEPLMTRDVVHVRRFKRLGEYRLKLWFTDGMAGEWDFSELAGRETGPMVKPFKNPDYFDRVFLEFGALTWPNGYDWSPEALHADMLAAGALKFEEAAA